MAGSRITRRFFSGALAASLTAWLVSCSPDYRDLSTANGRQAILDEADNLLTSGDCEGAIRVLLPLVQSPHNNNDVMMKYSSAYACKGGVNFPNLLGALKDGGDIWTALVKSNHSAGKSDGKLDALDQATSILLQTATPPGDYAGRQRSANASLFMIFIQVNTVATTISPLGNADPATGKRRQAMCTSCAAEDQCRVQVAFSFVTDSLDYAGGGTSLDSLKNSVNNVCSAAFGAKCPENFSQTQCLNTPALQAQGQALIDSINNQWGT